MSMPYERFTSLASLSTITSQPDNDLPTHFIDIPGIETCEIPVTLQPFINLKSFVLKRSSVCPGNVCASRTCTVEVPDGTTILTWETQCGDDTTMYYNEKGPVMSTEVLDNCYYLRLLLAGCQSPRMVVTCNPFSTIGTVYYHSAFGCTPEFEVRDQNECSLYKIQRTDVCCCDCGSHAYQVCNCSSHAHQIVSSTSGRKVGLVNRETSFCVAEGATTCKMSKKLPLLDKILLTAAVSYIDQVGENGDCYVQSLIPCA